MKRVPKWRTRRMISIGLFLLVVALSASRALAPTTDLVGPMPVGVDVSHHQGAIDWDELARDDVTFAYIKATEGGDWVDPRFTENWRRAGRTAIARGAYHFFTLCTPADIQAANFIAAIGQLENDLPPALDIEHMGPCREGPTMVRPAEDALVFLDILEAHYGVRPIIYTTRQFHNAHLTEITGERFWVRSILRKPNWRTDEWTLWQFHNRGTRRGVNGPVDLNRFKGTTETLNDMLVSGG